MGAHILWNLFARPTGRIKRAVELNRPMPAATMSTRRIDEIKAEPLERFISPLVELPPDTTLAKMLGLMKDRGVYEVFIPEGSRCGMICARELLRATNIDTTKTASLTANIPVLRSEAIVGEVARLMADYRLRAAPITDGRRIIGQVNATDLLKELRGRIEGDLRVTSLATKTPITVPKTSSMAKARDILVRKRIDHLPVTDESHLAGLITSPQIISYLTEPQRIGSKSIHPQTKSSLDFPVEDAMDLNPLTCSTDTTTEHALELMLSHAGSCVLVTQWEELQGIVTQRDFMTILAEIEPEPEIPVFIVGLPDDPFESEATKAKFKRIVRQLHKVLPDIVEARSVIKSKPKAGSERRRYEVSVQIRTPTESFSYSEEGWDLPEVYDLITDRLKRLMTKKQKPRRLRERESTEQP